MVVEVEVLPLESPRLILIDGLTYPTVSVQELYNALREYEDSEEGQLYPFLISAAGKESLGGGVTVGITATLQNAKVLFRGNLTPLDDGSGRTCDSTDTRTLYVNDADFVSDGVQPGDVVFNYTNGEMATITEVVDQYTLDHLPLAGHGGLGWTNGDNYTVYENIQCNLSGGNLVAVDDLGAEITPVSPSPLVQVVRTSSSSATLSELDAIQYSSYGGGVSLDITTSNTGTNYPVGNQEFPVNNLTDAISIANMKGFRTLFILSSMTGGDAIDSGTNINGFKLIGVSQTNTQIEIDSNALASNVTIESCTVFGTLDGGTTIDNCYVGEVVYFNGLIHNCGLYGTIYLDGNDSAFEGCYTYDHSNTPIIDMGGSGQSLALPSYAGKVIISNLSDASQKVGIALISGHVYLENTITAGLVSVSGVGSIDDNSGGTTIVKTEGLLNKSLIGEAVWDEPIGDHLIDNTMGHEMLHRAYDGIVYINTVTGTSGTTFPTGTREDPVDNLTDALTIANAHYFNIIHIEGSYTMNGEDITGMTIAADRSTGNTLTITSMTNTGTCYFQDLTVEGALSGQTRFTTCVMGALTGYDGGSKNCLITDDIAITGTGANYFTDCDTYVTDYTFQAINVGNHLLNIIRCRGSWQLTNYTGSSVLVTDFSAAQVDIDSTCTSGVIVVSGLVNLTDNSSPGCTVIDGTISESGITDKVWDELLSGHTDAGSAGRTLTDGSDPAAIATAVWEETVATPNPNTFGATVKAILQYTDNKLVINQSTSELWLYDDDGVTVLKKWPLIDASGGAINVVGVTAPVDRGERTA